ncbi:MAG: tetratricopeptide repeat protein, partial [Anaerolineales bacterium]
LAISIRDVEGDPRQAFNLFAESRKLARAIGNQGAEAHNLGHIAILRAEWGEYTAAVENYRECLALFRAAGLRQDVAGYLNPLASLYRALGQYELAAAALDEALRISVEVEHAQIQGWTHLNLGRLALELGQPDQARESYASAFSLATEHHIPLIEAHALLGLGQVHLANSDFNAASQQLSRALGLFAELDTGAAVLTRAYMGLAHLGLGELDTALTHSRAALESVESGVGTFLEVQQVYLYHFRVLRAMGASADAQRWLDKGRAITLAQADRLNEDWRATFLGVVPVNREIMATWEVEGQQKIMW